jgi:hypothetical protein
MDRVHLRSTDQRCRHHATVPRAFGTRSCALVVGERGIGASRQRMCPGRAPCASRGFFVANSLGVRDCRKAKQGNRLNRDGVPGTNCAHCWSWMRMSPAGRRLQPGQVNRRYH